MNFRTPSFLVALLCLAMSLASAQDNLWKTNLDAGDQLLKEHRYAEAEKRFLETLKEAERRGYQDERIALSLYKLGSTYAAQGKYTEAEPLLRRDSS